MIEIAVLTVPPNTGQRMTIALSIPGRRTSIPNRGLPVTIRVTNLDGVPDGYRVMNICEAIKMRSEF